MQAQKSGTPRDKLQELILFIARRSDCDPRFGAIKLNKLLFFSDFLAYVKLGKSITGHVYQRLPKGPAPRAMLPTLKRMMGQKLIVQRDRDYYGKPQKVVVPLREPNVSCFSPEEISVVTEVLDAFHKNNAKGISTLSHRFDGWKLAKDGEDIPYPVALVQLRKTLKADVQKIMGMADEIRDLRAECPPSDAD